MGEPAAGKDQEDDEEPAEVVQGEVAPTATASTADLPTSSEAEKLEGLLKAFQETCAQPPWLRKWKAELEKHHGEVAIDGEQVGKLLALGWATAVRKTGSLLPLGENFSLADAVRMTAAHSSSAQIRTIAEGIETDLGLPPGALFPPTPESATTDGCAVKDEGTELEVEPAAGKDQEDDEEPAEVVQGEVAPTATASTADLPTSSEAEKLEGLLKAFQETCAQPRWQKPWKAELQKHHGEVAING